MTDQERAAEVLAEALRGNVGPQWATTNAAARILAALPAARREAVVAALTQPITFPQMLMRENDRLGRENTTLAAQVAALRAAATAMCDSLAFQDWCPDHHAHLALMDALAAKDGGSDE